MERGVEIEELFFEVDGSAVCLDGDEGIILVNGRPVWFREGYWMEDGGDGEWMPDWSLTWVYSDRTDPAGSCIYFEQDPAETAIHNFLHIIAQTAADAQAQAAA